MRNVYAQRFALGLLVSSLAFLPGTRADLVGFWSLNGDTLADFGGWGASSAVAGGNAENDISFAADVPASISGRANQSIAFDGNNDDRVDTGFNAGSAGVSGLPALTLSYWVKPNGTVNNRAFVFLGNNAALAGEVISTEPTENTRLASYYFNGNRISTLGSLVSNAWNHVAITYETNHGTSRVFVNGIDASGTSASPANTINLPIDATLSLGGRVSGNGYANNVQLAELAIWNHVLDDTQIQSLANGTSPLAVPEPTPAFLMALGAVLLRMLRGR